MERQSCPVLRLLVKFAKPPRDTMRAMAKRAGDVSRLLSARTPPGPRGAFGECLDSPDRKERPTRGPICTLPGLGLCSRDQFEGFI